MHSVPQMILDVCIGIDGDNEKIWKTDLPVEQMNIDELIRMFDYPFWDKPGGYYDLSPWEVFNFPEKFKEEYSRTMKADLSYPLDICFNEKTGKWITLDGLHRLLKSYMIGTKQVNVRKFPKEMLDLVKI